MGMPLTRCMPPRRLFMPRSLQWLSMPRRQLSMLHRLLTLRRLFTPRPSCTNRINPRSSIRRATAVTGIIPAIQPRFTSRSVSATAPAVIGVGGTGAEDTGAVLTGAEDTGAEATGAEVILEVAEDILGEDIPAEDILAADVKWARRIQII